MSRRAVTDALERLAFAAELLDDRRARSFGAASWAVRNLDGEVSAMHASGELAKTRGIGKATHEVIGEVLRGERPARLVELEAKLPAGLFAVRKVKGLGPKKVKALWRELGVTGLAELAYACNENRLVDLKGFGKKTQDKVLAQIREIEQNAGLHRRDRAEALLAPVVEALDAMGVGVRVVGDYARGLPLVRELGVLVADADTERARDEAKQGEVEVTVHAAPAAQLGAAEVWLTSSDGHRASLERRARSRGLTFTPAGMTGDDPCPRPEDFYAALGLLPTPVERRDDDVPLVEVGRSAPRLVRREDLRGALHNHTVASDGSATLEEMRAAAEQAELEYLGISEHSVTAFYARGLDTERLRAQLEAVRALNETPGCVLLTGVESDILSEGQLDYEDGLLASLDVVVASVHGRLSADPDVMTARMVEAASQPYADIIGHPTGRLLLGRAPSTYDMERFLDTCVETGTAVELNANPARLDLGVEHLRMAKERGVRVSISADAHSTRELEHLAHGIAVARRAGLTAEDVLNTRSEGELRQWLAARRPGS
ncbi:MAG: helix-hairpin-helix domain-containing protein [Sandaracinaceae bacterium]